MYEPAWYTLPPNYTIEGPWRRRSALHWKPGGGHAVLVCKSGSRKACAQACRDHDQATRERRGPVTGGE